jgi:hypothetical protein
MFPGKASFQREDQTLTEKQKTVQVYTANESNKVYLWPSWLTRHAFHHFILVILRGCI